MSHSSKTASHQLLRIDATISEEVPVEGVSEGATVPPEIVTQRLRLVPVQKHHLDALEEGTATLGRLLGMNIPSGWPQFPGALTPVRTAEPVQHWGNFLFLRRDKPLLVGNGGYKGLPDGDGAVELCYEIAPAFRRQGLASEATMALVSYALARPEVSFVQAHTLTGDRASSGVLKWAGLRLTTVLNDSRQEVVSRWRLSRLDSPRRPPWSMGLLGRDPAASDRTDRNTLADRELLHPSLG